MKTRLLLTGMSLALLLLFSSCNNYGEELTFGNLQLFYTENVDKAEAEDLGAYLEDSEFTGKDKISVQLDKEDDTYQFRMVVKEGISEDEKYHAYAKVYAQELSENVFDNAPVDFHFCDETLKTEKVIEFED